MPLRLEYRASTRVPVEVEGILPSAVAGKSIAEIERMEILHGNRRLPLAEFFHATGDPADLAIHWEGDLAGVHWIGARMDGGRMHVAGSVGRHTGSGMTAGEIAIEGDAGDWLGAEMHGGRIRVGGSAGDLVGAAYRGSRRGMTGGEIFVEGSAGSEIGRTMRRGLIAVRGAGDAPGANMIAGSILIFGPCGIRPGPGMRRGTIGLFGPSPPPLLPTFRLGCTFEPLFLRLIFSHLRQSGYAVPEGIGPKVELYHGDLVALGKGEIVVGNVD